MAIEAEGPPARRRFGSFNGCFPVTL